MATTGVKIGGGSGWLGSQTFTGTAAPATDNDASRGYLNGDVWVDTTSDKVYVCADNTNNAAIWKEMAAADVLGAVTVAASNPTTSHNLAAGYAGGAVWLNSSTHAVFVLVIAASGLWYELQRA